MNVLSVFDGISCGQLALERAGIDINTYYASEIHEDSIKVTQHNYPSTIQLGSVVDLTEEKLKELPKIDMLIGGSPCQGLSSAKSNRKNLEDHRSKLFYEYVRIKNWLIENKNHNLIFLMENVIVTDKPSLEIMNKEMGVHPIEINSGLVSAQNRRRLYWTNIQGIEQPEDKGLYIKDIIYDNNYKVVELKDEKLLSTLKKSKNYYKWDTSFKGYYSQANRAYFTDKKMGTVPKARASSKLNIWLGDNKFRRIHPIEAERLQTLPDNYTKVIETKNDDVRVGVVGDGWTVDVIAHIFSYIKKR